MERVRDISLSGRIYITQNEKETYQEQKRLGKIPFLCMKKGMTSKYLSPQVVTFRHLI
jgi:hypothetical protein